MHRTKIIVSTFILLLMSTVMIQAQGTSQQKADSVTDQELKKVASTMKDLRSIQRDANKQLRSVVKESGMDFKRYQTIMIAKKSGKTDSLNITKKEQEKVKKIQPQLTKINKQSKQKLQKVIKKHGLTQKRLQEIMMVLRSKPDVQKRFQKIMAQQKKK